MYMDLHMHDEFNLIHNFSSWCALRAGHADPGIALFARASQTHSFALFARALRTLNLRSSRGPHRPILSRSSRGPHGPLHFALFARAARTLHGSPVFFHAHVGLRPSSGSADPTWACHLTVLGFSTRNTTLHPSPSSLPCLSFSIIHIGRRGGGVEWWFSFLFYAFPMVFFGFYSLYQWDFLLTGLFYLVCIIVPIIREADEARRIWRVSVRHLREHS